MLLVKWIEPCRRPLQKSSPNVVVDFRSAWIVKGKDVAKGEAPAFVLNLERRRGPWCPTLSHKAAKGWGTDSCFAGAADLSFLF